jgi:hypothetical protein
MNALGKQLLSLILILSLAIPALAQDWFDNNDSLTELAHLAPSDSALFAALDLSKTMSSEEIALMLTSLVKEAGGPNALAEMKRELGDVDEIATVFGTRMVIAVVAPQGEEPQAILAWEAKQPDKAADLLKAVGMIPSRDADKTIKIGDSTFDFIGQGGFGIYQDYLIISNSPEALRSTLVEGQSLHDQPEFHDYMARVSVDQGLLFYGEIPDAFVQELPDLESLSHLLASLGVSDHELVTQIYAVLNKDGKLTRALLSEPGILKGEAARFIPDDWGFMVTFHLGYVHRFINHLQEDHPQLARDLVDARQDVEEEIGVRLQELLKVVEGEVSISSNGLAMLPLYYLGMGSHAEYKLTVTMPVKDNLAAQALLRGAWERLDLKTEKLLDDIVVVSGAELCYVIEKQQLLMSYGPSALETLRECLALREGDSLISRPEVTAQFPVANGVAFAYLDLRPLIQGAQNIPHLGFLESILLSRDAILDSTTAMSVQPDGLKLVGTGGMPLVAGVGVGAAFFLGTSFDNKAAGSEEVRTEY